MIEDKQVTVDEMSVTITAFTAMKAMRLKGKYLGYLGPGLLGAVRSLKSTNKKLMESEIDGNVLADGFQHVITTLSEDKVQEIFLELLAGVTINGTRVGELDGFNAVFSGKLESVYKVVWEVIRFNYGSFFKKGDIGQVFKNLLK